MTLLLDGISSMATRQVLQDMAMAYRACSGVELRLESVGGVDAARRVQDGETFDVVFLAADALDRLATAGFVLSGSRVDLVRSGVAVAVRAGTQCPDISTEAALRHAVLQARSLSVSTGPSGVALRGLLARWGLAETLHPRLVTPPPGVPVASLVARGEVELGFQQLSEMLHVPGIAVLGGLPTGCEIVTVFSGAVATSSRHPEAVRDLLTFMAAPDTADAKRRQGMEPA
jgi:molybdate transport system substrate-binding protein